MTGRAPIHLVALLALGAVASHLAAGCSEPTPPPDAGETSPLFAPPKELVLPIPRTPDRLSPLAGDEIAARLQPFLFQGLTRIDGTTGSPLPSLALSWEVGQGGREYVFRLPTDLKWSDGHPFGPEDVVFTLQDLVHAEAYPNPFRPLLQFEGAEGPVYPTTEVWVGGGVRLLLPEPYPPLLRALARIPILPRHRLHDDFVNGPIFLAWKLSDPPSHVVGTGTSSAGAATPGDAPWLAAVGPYYARRGPGGETLPRLDRVTLRVPREAGPPGRPAADRAPKDPLRAFLVGEIDLLVPTEPQAAELRRHARRDPRIVVHEPGPAPENTFLTFRHGVRGMHAAFADVRFRRAISHALDRQRMIDAILGGHGRAQWSPIGPSQPAFHADDVPRFSFDRDEAARLLDEVGLADRNGNGVRETLDGASVRLTILMRLPRHTPPHTRRIADLIVADLARVGIRATVEPRTDQEILRALYARDWDAFLHASPDEIDPHLLGGIWRSDRLMHYWSPEQPEPATEWEAEIDAIFEADARLWDDAERRGPLLRFQRIAARELPVIHTVQRMPLVAVRGRVRHFAPSPVGIYHDVDLWDVEP